jgi:hypothetical protein
MVHSDILHLWPRLISLFQNSLHNPMFIMLLFLVVVGSDRMHLQFSLLTSKRGIHAFIAFSFSAAVCQLETSGMLSSLDSINGSGRVRN